MPWPQTISNPASLNGAATEFLTTLHHVDHAAGAVREPVELDAWPRLRRGWHSGRPVPGSAGAQPLALQGELGPVAPGAVVEVGFRVPPLLRQKSAVHQHLETVELVRQPPLLDKVVGVRGLVLDHGPVGKLPALLDEEVQVPQPVLVADPESGVSLVPMQEIPVRPLKRDACLAFPHVPHLHDLLHVLVVGVSNLDVQGMLEVVAHGLKDAPARAVAQLGDREARAVLLQFCSSGAVHHRLVMADVLYYGVSDVHDSSLVVAVWTLGTVRDYRRALQTCVRQSSGRGFGSPRPPYSGMSGMGVWTLRLAIRSDAVGDQPVSTLTAAPLRLCGGWTGELLPQKSIKPRGSTANARLWA